MMLLYKTTQRLLASELQGGSPNCVEITSIRLILLDLCAKDDSHAVSRKRAENVQVIRMNKSFKRVNAPCF